MEAVAVGCMRIRSSTSARAGVLARNAVVTVGPSPESTARPQEQHRRRQDDGPFALHSTWSRATIVTCAPSSLIKKTRNRFLGAPEIALSAVVMVVVGLSLGGSAADLTCLKCSFLCLRNSIQNDCVFEIHRTLARKHNF